MGGEQERDGGTLTRKVKEEVGQKRRWQRKSVWGREEGHWDPSRVQYLLEAAAPDTVLPAPICTLGVQAGGTVGQEVTGGGAGQWGRRFYRHWRHIQQRVAEACPVIGGLH